MAALPTEPPAPPRPTRRLFLRQAVLGVVCGVLAAALLGLVVMAVRFRNATPILRQADFDEAVRLWQEHGPAGYDLELVQTGNQPGRIHVSVRRGKVTAMTRDGRAPQQRRTWEYWTVPNQLEFIRIDMARAAQARERGGVQMVQRAEFDPLLGYPKKYQCIDVGGHEIVVGTPVARGQRVTQWEIVRFEIKP